MVAAQLFIGQNPDTSLIFSVIIALSLIALMLLCMVAVCTIAASFVIMVVYIICECICCPIFKRLDCDLERGARGLHRARIITYQAVIPNYFQSLEEEVDEGEELRKQALDKLLPLVVYGASKLKSRDCAICLDEFKVDDSCKVFPVCKHVFHLKCIDEWLKNHLTCPVCRKCVLET